MDKKLSIDSLLENVGQTYIKSAKELKKDVEKACKSMEEAYVDIGSYKAAMDNIIDYADGADKLVNEVTKTAKKTGVKKALEDESVYGAIRKVFPTGRDYMAYQQKGIETIKDSLSQMGGSFDFTKDPEIADTEEDKEHAKAANVMIRKLFEKAGDFADSAMKLSKGYTEEMLERVYGK